MVSGDPITTFCMHKGRKDPPIMTACTTYVLFLQTALYLVAALSSEALGCR